MESLPNDIKIQILKFIPRRVHPCSHMIKRLRKRDEFALTDDDFLTSLCKGKERVMQQCVMYPSHSYHYLYLFMQYNERRNQAEQSESEDPEDGPMW